ncbi:MAG: phosphotransferase family protein [bacterium]
MNDIKLPGLRQAVNGDDMRITLSTVLRRDLERDQPDLSGVRLHVLKHTRGKRCVIEYWLKMDENHLHDQRVIGKLYRKNRGEKIHENLRNMWNVRHRKNGHDAYFGMPEPLAYLPELGMTLQSVVPGRQLSSLSDQGDLLPALRLAAANLAIMHGMAVPSLETRTMDDHLNKYCHPSPEELMAACPELAPLVEGILEGIRSDESLLDAPLCTVHGDLGLNQIFVTPEHAYFIDFDGSCISHPALDLANFLVALQVHFGTLSRVLMSAFMESYLAIQSPRMFTGLRTYQAFTYLRRATICFRGKEVAGWREHVRSLLKTGYALLIESERRVHSDELLVQV